MTQLLPAALEGSNRNKRVVVSLTTFGGYDWIMPGVLASTFTVMGDVIWARLPIEPVTPTGYDCAVVPGAAQIAMDVVPKSGFCLKLADKPEGQLMAPRVTFVASPLSGVTVTGMLA